MTAPVASLPLCVDTTISEPVANEAHGTRYGVDWIYHDDRLGYLPALPCRTLEAALASPAGEGASSVAPGVIVRHNDDGTLDEVVGTGEFHLEQMDSNKWWMQLGPHMVTLTARGKISAWFGENEAQLPAPPASTETDKQTATGDQP